MLRVSLLLCAIAAFASAQTSHPVLEQWVAQVTNYSSQYSAHGWAAHNVVGPPTVYPQYGDLNGVWAQETIDANQFIEVQYAQAVYVDGIDIYETFHAGAVKRVAARNACGQWVTLWQTFKVEELSQSRIFSPPLTPTTFKTKDIRIETDCTAAGTWAEIDCIKLRGRTDHPASSIVQAGTATQSTNNPRFVYESQTDQIIMVNDNKCYIFHLTDTGHTLVHTDAGLRSVEGFHDACDQRFDQWNSWANNAEVQTASRRKTEKLLDVLQCATKTEVMLAAQPEQIQHACGHVQNVYDVGHRESRATNTTQHEPL